MAKHDDPQQDSSNQSSALSRQDERSLARALTDLAAALRERTEVVGRTPNADATFAANEYRQIKNALRTFLEKAPERAPDYYSKPKGS